MGYQSSPEFNPRGSLQPRKPSTLIHASVTSRLGCCQHAFCQAAHDNDLGITTCLAPVISGLALASDSGHLLLLCDPRISWQSSLDKPSGFHTLGLDLQLCYLSPNPRSLRVLVAFPLPHNNMSLGANHSSQAAYPTT